MLCSRAAHGDYPRNGFGLAASEVFPSGNVWGVNALKAPMGPFGHSGVKFIPTGGITAATLPNYMALPPLAAVGGSWMVDRKLVAEKKWDKITALTAEAVKIAASSKKP